MRTILITLLWLAFSVMSLQAQNTIRVEKIQTLTTPEQGLFFYPKLTPDGKKVLFTGPQFTGLYVLELGQNQIKTLNKEPGAGYEYQIGPDGAFVYYRTSTFVNYKKYYTLKKQSLSDAQTQVLEKQVRELTTPRMAQNEIFYLKEKQAVQKAVIPLLKKANAKEKAAVFADDGKMILVVNGETAELAPLGYGMYIWPQISPDGQRIVFTFGGDATYVCDLQGRILAKIGYANAPVWSPDGKWIAYMVDHDNGDYFTDSEIFISSADGKTKVQITNTPHIIEMYPDWGGKMNQLVFASNRGQIFLATLSLEQ